MIVVEVTVADRPSVQFQMGGWMDGSMYEVGGREPCPGVGGVSKEKEVDCGDRQTETAIHSDI